jgi:hypothetical protein
MALRVKGQAVGVVGVLAEHRALTGLGVVAHNAACRDVGEE